MSLLSSLAKGIQTAIDDYNTPESFKIGEQFEQYVRNKLFIEHYYGLLERSHNYRTNQQDYVWASLKPDFTFRDRITRRDIFVEVKFRTGLYNGKVEWCKEKQLVRYQGFSQEKPTFLLLGLGENPNRPEFVALVRMAQARYTGLFPSFLREFEVPADQPIPSKRLWAKG